MYGLGEDSLSTRTDRPGALRAATRKVSSKRRAASATVSVMRCQPASLTEKARVSTLLPEASKPIEAALLTWPLMESCITGDTGDAPAWPPEVDELLGKMARERTMSALLCPVCKTGEVR